ncbi:Derepression protein [Providencia manganoxydans]|uniref:Derepression protein n=1 Tax=Providencia manganoxydans TaxID=2923283 RepID=UPI0034E529B5
MMKKPQITIESYHKLNRAKLLAHSVYLELNKNPLGGMNQLYVPILFCYLSEDISDIFEELKQLGLCDDWLRQSKKD